MSIILKDIRFVNYDPDADETKSIRPLTAAEVLEFWACLIEHGMDEWRDREMDFAAEHTCDQANQVDWDLVFEEEDRADTDMLFAIVKEDILECAREEGISEEAITGDVFSQVRAALDSALEDWSVVVKEAISRALKAT